MSYNISIKRLLELQFKLSEEDSALKILKKETTKLKAMIFTKSYRSNLSRMLIRRPSLKEISIMRGRTRTLIMMLLKNTEERMRLNAKILTPTTMSSREELNKLIQLSMTIWLNLEHIKIRQLKVTG